MSVVMWEKKSEWEKHFIYVDLYMLGYFTILHEHYFDQMTRILK